MAFSRGHQLADYPKAMLLDRDDLLTLDCDLLVPAAKPDAVRADNADEVRAAVILPGANIAITPAAEAMLHARGVLCVPDFIANAGGAICAAVELRGGTRAQAFAEIAERIQASTAELLDRIAVGGLLPRAAAEEMARARLDLARSLRRRVPGRPGAPPARRRGREIEQVTHHRAYLPERSRPARHTEKRIDISITRRAVTSTDRLTRRPSNAPDRVTARSLERPIAHGIMEVDGGCLPAREEHVTWRTGR